MSTIASLPRKKTEPPADKADLVYELVPLADIIDDAKNPRLESKDAKEKIARLTRSIQARGVQQPVKLFGAGHDFHVVFGSRRILAARAAGLTHIPAALMDHVPTPAEREDLRAVENFDRADLNPAEEALQALALLEAHGGRLGEAAAAIDRPVKWLKDRLYLQRLCTPVRDMVALGLVSMGHAREIAKCGDAGDQKDLAERVKITGANGYERVFTIEQVRGMVENKKASLRVVGWELDKPFAGKPACVGCPHNSASDAALFDTSKEEAEKGCCLSPSCFNAKAKAVTKAQEKIVEELKADVKAKRVEKGNAGNAALIAERTPEFLKASSVQRTVKRELRIGEPKPDAATRRHGGTAEGGRPGNPYAKPLLAWAKAMRQWRKQVEAGIAEASARSPALAILALILDGSALLVDSPLPLPQDYHFEPGSGSEWLKARAPRPERPVGAETAALLDPQRTSTFEGLCELAKYAADFRSAVSVHAGPDLATRIAKAFGITPPPAPVYEDFLPAILKTKPVAGGQLPVASKKPGAAAPAAKPGTCRRCGCTQDSPCEGGCSWAAANKTLCSRCVGVTPFDAKAQPVDYKTAGIALDELYDGFSPAAAVGVVHRVLWYRGDIPCVCADFSGGAGDQPDRYTLLRLVPWDRWTGGEPLKSSKRPRYPVAGLVVVDGAGIEFVVAGDGVGVLAPQQKK